VIRPETIHMPTDRADALDAFLRALRTSPFFAPQVVFEQTTPGREAEYAEPARPWLPEIEVVLRTAGVERLYAHQARAIDLVRSGRHTVVATPTASGKTLVYTLPILERIVADPSSRTLYLSPLKALAQDQLRSLTELCRPLESLHEIRAAIYDGDTSAHFRRKMRDRPPHVLLSNPEMLHLSFLPYHGQWHEFLRRLEFVVVDEVHSYRGVMGSNMAWVFRRLLRVCEYYGSRPTFVFCSATVGNPGDLANGLTGLTAECVTDSTSPSGAKHFFFVNPLEGAARMTVNLLLSALPKGIRTIVYTQSRRMTELIAMWCGDRMGPLKHKVSAYRAGFLPGERREIERKLASGELLAVISTSALELGIDIGSLDLCLLVGYPGSVMATLQRGGRVGRSRGGSAVVLIGHEDALDQYFMNNPAEFFKLKPESAVINPENPVIAGRHLECAAAELPLRRSEPLCCTPEIQRTLGRLLDKGRLLESADLRELLCPKQHPQRDVDLRGAGRPLSILETESREHIGEVDLFRCFTETHPGAVYLHRGQTYVVDELAPETGQVLAHREKVSYYTRARQEKSTEILERNGCRQVLGTTVCRGLLRVTARVTGYEKRLVKGQQLLTVVPLDLPPLVFETEGLWIEVPDELRHETERLYMHFMGGIHAVEHAAIGILPLLVLTDRNDLGGISTPLHPQVGKAAVFVYDAVPGGVGLTRQAYGLAEELLRRTRGVVCSCGCETGCPACVHSPKCGSGNRPIDKNAAAFLLGRMTGEASARAKGPDSTPKPMPHSTPAPGQQQRLSPDPAPSPQPVPIYEALEFASLEDTVRDAAPAKTSREAPARFAVLDLETCRSAQEVGGWHNAREMGVSCAVLYDSAQDRFLSFTAQEITSLVGQLVEYDMVVGFNISRFDYAVLSGCSRFDFNSLPTLDMLQDVRKRLGYGLSLEHLARETLGRGKSGNGLQALEWWKQGRMDLIVEYCTGDVALTRDLYLFGRENGYLLFRNKAGSLVRVPVAW
jgi:DEAD/DEAH box helicase domain-containing protein